MWKKVLVAGSVGAVILGAGGVALASTGSTAPSPSPSTSPSTGHANGPSGKASKQGKDGTARGDLRRGLLRSVHGQVTTKTKSGFVTYDGIKGIVTAVSPTSISIKAADGTSETYAVTGSTVVHTKADGKNKGATGQIGKVQDGDGVAVLGTGTGTLTATHVVDTSR